MRFDSKATHVLRVFLWITASGVLAYFALRASPNLRDIGWLPRAVSVWADRHGVLRNLPAFALLYLVSLPLFGLRRLWAACLVACLTVVALECGQLAVPGRTFDWHDILAGCAGVLAAHMGVLAWSRLRRRESAGG